MAFSASSLWTLLSLSGTHPGCFPHFPYNKTCFQRTIQHCCGESCRESCKGPVELNGLFFTGPIKGSLKGDKALKITKWMFSSGISGLSESVLEAFGMMMAQEGRGSGDFCGHMAGHLSASSGWQWCSQGPDSEFLKSWPLVPRSKPVCLSLISLVYVLHFSCRKICSYLATLCPLKSQNVSQHFNVYPEKKSYYYSTTREFIKTYFKKIFLVYKLTARKTKKGATKNAHQSSIFIF